MLFAANVISVSDQLQPVLKFADKRLTIAPRVFLRHFMSPKRTHEFPVRTHKISTFALIWTTTKRFSGIESLLQLMSTTDTPRTR